MNPTDRPSDPVSPTHEINRRNFMKKSALSVGAVTILGTGMAVASTSGECPAKCRYILDENGVKVAKDLKAHTSSCKIVKNVVVTFTEVIPHPAPDAPDKSGRVFKGKLVYTVATFNKYGLKIGLDNPIEVDVTTGGFFDSNQLNKGDGTTCDTAYPSTLVAEPYNLNLLPGGGILGFQLQSPVPNREPVIGRTALEIHYRIRQTEGSSGCIVFANGPPCPGEMSLTKWQLEDHGNEWKEFDELMRQTRNCENQSTNVVPLTVHYTLPPLVPAPIYVWKTNCPHY